MVKKTANGAYVTYFRVSTRKQGRSGLGLEAQQASVNSFLNTPDGICFRKKVAELVEVESGKLSSRPKLAEALALCRSYNATLVIAKLDRLSRNLNFVTNLMESKVSFIAADMPTANKFTVHIMASVAEQEADMIAERTKKAMRTAKEKGTLLGRRDAAIAAFHSKGAKISAEVRSEKAMTKCNDLLPVINAIRAEGATSLRRIAQVMSERELVTPRGGYKWTATQVARILQRVA